MMKGKSLIELAQAVQDMAGRKVDVVADTRNIRLQVEDGKASLEIREESDAARGVTHVAAVTPHAMNQITEHTGVPTKYAARMLAEAPHLLENNVNHWFREQPSLRMVRTLRSATGLDTGRAFLSNRYHRMENDQLLATVLPELLDSGLSVLSTELTDTRMYVKVVFPNMEGEVRKGDVVQYGFTLSNSEIGAGAMAVTPFVYRLVCLNGLTLSKDVDDARMRKAHLGRALEIGADYFADETLKADDHALQLKLRDTLRAMRDNGRWQAVLGKLRESTEGGEVADPIAAIERVANLLVLPKAEHNSVLTNFLKGGDMTRWGVVNAVTAVANDATDYDRAVELENAGGRILTLPASDWRVVAKAA